MKRRLHFEFTFFVATETEGSLFYTCWAIPKNGTIIRWTEIAGWITKLSMKTNVCSKNTEEAFSLMVCVLTISSMFFSEKYKWVSLRTYCCTVSSLLLFVWLGDFAIISKVIFPILKCSVSLWKQTVWAWYKAYVTWPENSYRFLGNNQVSRENVNEKYWVLKLMSNKMAAGGEMTGKSFSRELQSPLNHSTNIHIVYVVHY